jgi:cytochrome c peroxidase
MKIKKILWISFVFVLLSFVAAASGVSQESDELLRQARVVFQPLPSVMPSPKDNSSTPAKVTLGKMLFYERRLSASGGISCQTCHPMSTYAADCIPKSIGHLGKINPRNAPTVLNAGFQFSQHWRGDRPSLEDQADVSLLSPFAYANANYDEAQNRIKSIPGYWELFQKAFPGEKEPITHDNIARAISAFERTLFSSSRFDQFLAGGKKVLTDKERKGLNVFLDTGCAACHNGALVGGMTFQKFGVVTPYWKATGSQEIDQGRFDITKREEDRYIFKVPPLRNVSVTDPYFHDGSVNRIDRAVKIMAEVQMGKRLNEQDVESIVSFLGSLTGTLTQEVLTVLVLPPSR